MPAGGYKYPCTPFQPKSVGRLRFIQGERETGSFRALWFAFLIVIGGRLLDVLISISLGVSALPLNVIIGILLLLRLGTLVRIALECCHGCISRRVDANINPGVLLKDSGIGVRPVNVTPDTLKISYWNAQC
ncbi:hypothetical protein AAC387_Pa06g3209 [Persea americana]